MKVLVNATTCVIGGGVQVASAFISQAIRDTQGCDFRFAVSERVMQNLNSAIQHNKRIIMAAPSPARPCDGTAARKTLRSLEAEFRPDVVFTVFGPAYLRFDSPHVCGFANPWVLQRSDIAMSILNPIERLRVLAECIYKKNNLYANDYYWVETELAKQGLLRLLNIPATCVRVIPNVYSDIFEEASQKVYARSDNNNVRIFCLAAPYPHKNLKIIPAIASALNKKANAKYFRFIVTLPLDGPEVRSFWMKAKELNVVDMIENAGILKLQDCPQWYGTSDIVILPTLLEVFSATYLEAMVMGKPIVTTNLDFAHDICGDAAIYYEPFSAHGAAAAIEEIAGDQCLYRSLVQKGKVQLTKYPSPIEKYQMTVAWLKEVAAI